MLCWIVDRVVDAEHDREVLVLGRGRDHNLLDAVSLVGHGLGGIGEEAGAFHHDLYPLAAPGNGARFLLAEDLDLPAVDNNIIALVAHTRGKGAVVGVVGEEVGVGLGIGQVVDRDHLHVTVEAVLLKDGAVGEAANATETVDADANGHGESPGREGAGPAAGPATSRGAGKDREAEYTPAGRWCSIGPRRSRSGGDVATVASGAVGSRLPCPTP